MNTFPGSTLRLDRNEGTFLLPPAPREELRQLVGSLDFHLPPDPQARELRQTLGRSLRVSPEALLPFNHQGECLSRIRLSFPTPPRVLLLESSSPCAERIASWGGEIRRFSLTLRGEELAFDEERFLDEMARFSPQVVYLDCPNDPTGFRIPGATLARLASLCPSASFFVVDESYGEFAEETTLPLFQKGRAPKRLVALRSFAYAWGLSALQAGYALLGDEARARLEALPMEPLDGLNQALLAHLVGHYEEWMSSRVYSVRYLRDELVRRTGGLTGWKAFPSEGPFVLLHHQESRRGTLEKALSLRGIQVCFPSLPWDGTWLRVSIGREEELRRLLEVLEEIGEEPLPALTSREVEQAASA